MGIDFTHGVLMGGWTGGGKELVRAYLRDHEV